MNEPREYWPVFEGGRVTRRFRFANYQAAIVTDMRSTGNVEYLYVMLIFKMPEDKLCLCIASEKNRNYGRRIQGDQPFDFGASHFLGLFPGQGHQNFGTSNDWADIDRFTARALELARDHLKVSDEAVEEVWKKPWWRVW